MNISIYTNNTTVDVPICTSIKDIKSATEEDAEQERLLTYIIRGWPHTKEVAELGVENISL